MTAHLQIANFDYSIIAAPSVPILRASATSIKDKIRRTTQDILDTGAELAAAKDHLDHGQFIAWVESEVGIAGRTAQAYMAAAKLADAKGAMIALLPPTTVYRLAAKSAPADVVDAVVAQVKSGAMVSDKAVQSMLSDARWEQKQASFREDAAERERKLSKRKREQRSRQREVAQQQRERELAAICAAVESIRNRFSPADVDFLLGALNPDPWTILQALQSEGVQQ